MDNYILSTIQKKGRLNILEAHSGLSALIVQKSNFDGVWASSLTNSAIRGLPDTELLNGEERVSLIREMRRATTKAVVVDWDTGGQTPHFRHWAKELERAGTDAIVIEDKAFPKANSLKEGVNHILEDVDKFCDKISDAKDILHYTLLFARIESLIAKKSIYNALVRAEAYINAGADGILIHSKKEVDATEVMEFAKEYRKKFIKPLICVPTTYQLPESHPFDIVINANHLLRASMNAMEEYIMGNNPKLSTVKDIFEITGDKDKC